MNIGDSGLEITVALRCRESSGESSQVRVLQSSKLWFCDYRHGVMSVNSFLQLLKMFTKYYFHAYSGDPVVEMLVLIRFVKLL